MILANMLKKDVKVGLKIWAPYIGKCGEIISARNYRNHKLIIIKWDDNTKTYEEPYEYYMFSEVIGSFFIISKGRSK